MELWYPPTDQPHLLEWWRPLILASRKARQRRVHWPIHVDEMVLVGRVDRASRPSIWVYRHGEGGGELYLDATGQAYRYTRTPNAKGHGRFTTRDIRGAVLAAGLPHVVEPVWYDDPGRRVQWEGPVVDRPDDHDHDLDLDLDDEPDASPPAPAPVPRRRGHLTVIDGGAQPKAG